MKKTTLLQLGTGLLATLFSASAWSFTPSDQPPESSAVPGNVILALSVEFPTGLQVSYGRPAVTGDPRDTVFDKDKVGGYEGYFDNRKCYQYDSTFEVFQPKNPLSATKTCGAAEWSGNLLNWLTMTNLDQFRSVMTGGARDNFSTMNATHPGDTTARTVLIRSFSDRNSYNLEKQLRSTDPIPAAIRPAGTAVLRVRSGGYGSKFIVSTNGTFPAIGTVKATATLDQQKASCAGYAGSLSASQSCFNIRVEACVAVPLSPAIPTVGLESNCRNKYTGVAKPEGLIQQYASTLRFGAFGYLNQDGQTRNGGVMRAPLKSVGEYEATKTGIVANTVSSTSKTNMEWHTGTGVQYVNPDPVDTASTGVSNSGMINYLNKFGFAAGYKGNDPVGELYYAALRYLRGYSLPTEYTNSLTTPLIDGFPVITGTAHERGGSRDPIINSCQKNFILAIGDIYTHCDGNLPGSTKGLNATCGTGTPADADGLNVQTLWSKVTSYEGISDTGWIGGATSATPYVAGLAHWAHTNDIRPETAMPGPQSVSTYFVDVLENGNGVNYMPGAGTLRTQYWLAAKYGGFDKTLTASLTPNDNPNSRPSSSDPLPWDTNADGVPDNWFPGSDPVQLRNSLSAAFGKISNEAKASSASSAAVTSSRQTSNSQIIYAGYNPRDWSGSVSACSPSQTASQCKDSPIWEASEWLNSATTKTFVTTPLNESTRKLITSWSTSTSFEKMPFQWADLNAAQKAKLNNGGTLGSARTEYIRGSRANENSLFRVRPASLLGDIVNSGVTYLAGPSPALNGPKYPGHAAYRASTKNRPPVVYVGGNDGMLHAFSGKSVAGGGELFGYIPSSVFDNLPALTDLNFQHRYFVDSTPMVGDFQKSASTWGTMLVGGLGAGGKGYYALDISGQHTFEGASESTLKNIPMWEFTSKHDSDLGYTFNEPSIHPVTGVYQQIAKVADASTANGVWRVVIGNGYGSTGGDAVLFMLNAITGAKDIELNVGDDTNNGLSTPTPVDTDRDNLVDTVYAGDALGNMHKFQFSKLTGTDYVLAPSGDSAAAWHYIGRILTTGEPITTAPAVAPACDGNGWNVAFGSGKLNEETDYSDTSDRGFFAVVDKGVSSSITVPLTALSTIVYATSTLGSEVVRKWSTPNLTGKRGWKMAFKKGERVLTNSTLPPDTGVVLFGTTQPSGDVCSPGNAGYIMAVNLCSGRIGDLVVDGTTVGGLAIDSTGVVKVSNTYTDSANKPTVVCNQDDCKGNPPKLTPSVAPRGRYSWRELLIK